MGAARHCPIDGAPLVDSAGPEPTAGAPSLKSRAGRDSIGVHWIGLDPWRGDVRVHLLALPFDRPPGFLRWLNEEASAISRIGHPAWQAPTEIRETPDGNIVLLYPDAPDMEWREHVREAWPGQVPADRVLAYGTMLFDAMTAAEAAGYLHAGLKPSKLYVRADRSVLSLRVLAPSMWKALELTDSRAPRFLRPVDLLSGYESPEILRGGRPDFAADRWAAAAIIYELLTGFQPAGPAKIATALERYSTHGVDRVLSLRPDAPALAAAVLDRALCVDPSQRFATMAELSALWRSHAA